LFVTNRATCGAAVELFQESLYTDGYTQMFAVEGCPQLFGRFSSSCYEVSPEFLGYVSFYLYKSLQTEMLCSTRAEVLWDTQS